jgi:hypothetical protein
MSKLRPLLERNRAFAATGAHVYDLQTGLVTAVMDPAGPHPSGPQGRAVPR